MQVVPWPSGHGLPASEGTQTFTVPPVGRGTVRQAWASLQTNSVPHSMVQSFSPVSLLLTQ